MLQPAFGTGIFLIWILATPSVARNMLKKTCWGTFDTSEPFTWGEKHKSAENCLRKINYSLNSMIKRKCKLLLCGMSPVKVNESPWDTDVIQRFSCEIHNWRLKRLHYLFCFILIAVPSPQLMWCLKSGWKFQVLLSVQLCMRDGGGRAGGGGWWEGRGGVGGEGRAAEVVIAWLFVWSMCESTKSGNLSQVFCPALLITGSLSWCRTRENRCPGTR